MFCALFAIGYDEGWPRSLRVPFGGAGESVDRPAMFLPLDHAVTVYPNEQDSRAPFLAPQATASEEHEEQIHSVEDVDFASRKLVSRSRRSARMLLSSILCDSDFRLTRVGMTDTIWLLVNTGSCQRRL